MHYILVSVTRSVQRFKLCVNNCDSLPWFGMDCIHNNCKPRRPLFETDSGVIHWCAFGFGKLLLHQPNKLNFDNKWTQCPKDKVYHTFPFTGVQKRNSDMFSICIQFFQHTFLAHTGIQAHVTYRSFSPVTDASKRHCSALLHCIDWLRDIIYLSCTPLDD